jgi:Armadillo/beta-catenin-like repeat
MHEVVDVHCEALGVLINLSCDSEVGRRAIVDADALPEFVRLLSSSDPRVLQYASMVLNNISSQACFKTSVIDVGSCRPLVSLLQCVSVLICCS